MGLRSGVAACGPMATPDLDTGEMAKTDNIRLRRNPPPNASDIEVSADAIACLCKAGGLSGDECVLLDEHLPTHLLAYFISKAHESSAPTRGQREDSLAALEKLLTRLQKEIGDAPWLYGALVARETQDLFSSKEILRSMALRGYPEHEHWDKCSLRAIRVIKDHLQAVDRLRKGIGSLRDDPIGQLVAEQRSKQPNARQPRLDYLCQYLHVLWARVLGKTVSIGTKSRYVAFAHCLFDLVGENRSDDTMIGRLRAAKKTIELLKRKK